MREKIRNVLLYGGANKEDYENVKMDIYNYNRILVNVIAASTSMLLFSVFLSSFIVDGIAANRKMYGIGFIVTIVLLGVSLIFSKRYPKMVSILVQVSVFVFYIYGVVMGIVIEPDERAVIFVALLVFLQTFFIVPPLQMISISVLCALVFIYLCFQVKTGKCLNKDVITVLFFGTLGSIGGTLTTLLGVRSFVNGFHLGKIGRSDTLTGMNSRNAYELDLYMIPKACKKMLSCVYVDVNGLKTMNDRHGHKSGDVMLKNVAEKILEHFGADFAYRMGGDEFVIFVPDITEQALDNCINKLKTDIEACNYHVAIGCDTQKIDELSLTALQKNAEMMMYKDKASFYKNTEYERRRQ